MSIWQFLLGIGIGLAVLAYLLHLDDEHHPREATEKDNRGWWITLAVGGAVLLFLLNRSFRERLVTWVEDKLNLHHNEESSEDKDAIHARKTRPTPKQETPPSAETAYQGKPDMHGRVEATEEDLKHWTANNPDVKVVG